MFTPCPKLAYFSTGRPWSWYMANTASTPCKRLGLNKVSAGKGPVSTMPSARSLSSVGIMMSRSSCPMWPPSPAWGFSPATTICGSAMPNLRTKSVCKIRSTWFSSVGVMAAGTLASGRCVVAKATRIPPPTNIITTCKASVRSARYSVCPEKGMPASLITPLCTGAVTIAANRPVKHPSIAVSKVANT